MNRPWLLAALLAGLAVPCSAKSPLPDADIIQFFSAQAVALPASEEGKLPAYRTMFTALVKGDKTAYDQTAGSATTGERFDEMSRAAKALDEGAPRETAEGQAAAVETRRFVDLGAISKNAPSLALLSAGKPFAAEERGSASAREPKSGLILEPSLRLQGGLGQSQEGKTSPAAGFSFRLGVGSEKFGTVGPQGGVIWSGNGHSNQRLGHDLVDYSSSWRYGNWEEWEDTYRRVSGLNKYRLGGVSYKSPYLGGRVAFEAGIDATFAHLNTKPEIIRENYIREWFPVTCRDSEGNAIGGTCNREETRMLHRDVLSTGPGARQSGWGNTKYVAAEIANRSKSVAFRAEVSKDSFKAFPEASGWSGQGGVTFNFGK